MRQKVSYKYVVKPRATLRIWSFYRNVARKYRHTYAEEDMIKNIQKAVRSIKLIEHTLQRRKPAISRWHDYNMAHAGNWYYAYTINDDVITIVDACHAQNMHD